MRGFYSHLVEINSTIIEFDKLDLSQDQKIHLTSLIDSSLYHTILDVILSELATEEKRLFINHLKEDDKEKIWDFLNEKIDNIEDKIKRAAADLQQELHKDLKEASKKK